MHDKFNVGARMRGTEDESSESPAERKKRKWLGRDKREKEDKTDIGVTRSHGRDRIKKDY